MSRNVTPVCRDTRRAKQLIAEPGVKWPTGASGRNSSTDHQVGRTFEHRACEPGDLARVDGGVAVAERHEFGACRGQAGVAGRAVSALRATDDGRPQRGGDIRRTVG